MATPDTARAFGDVTAVPMLLLFDRDGKTAASFYGAPPTLHTEAEAKLDLLLRSGSGGGVARFRARASR
jgi:hypothetical protein